MKYILLIAFLLFPLSLKAQINFPEFSLSSQSPEIAVSGSGQDAMKTALEGINNPLMRDMLILQNQINILEKMIIRQNEIQTIAANYEQVGIPFNQPAPPRSVCEQLPTNLLCLSFYPDLPMNKQIVAESKARAFERQQQAIADILDDIRRNSGSGDPVAEFNDAIANPEPPRGTYEWADIKCRGGECSALLVSTVNGDDRIRVSVGDMIPDTDIKITSITTRAVKIHENGNEETLDPMPLGGVGSAPVQTASVPQVQNILQRNLPPAMQGNPSSSNRSDTADTNDDTNTSDAIADERLTAPPMLLGPTGLF